MTELIAQKEFSGHDMVWHCMVTTGAGDINEKHVCVYISVHISPIKWVTNEHVTQSRTVTQGRFLEGAKEKCGKELRIIYSLSCELNCRRKYKACVGKMSRL